jgi:hypothetical protein
VKKLVLLGASTIAVATAALLQPTLAGADPASVASLNVVGEPYAKAVAILKSQGVKSTFGGSFGSDVPQTQCIVDRQKVVTAAKMVLMLNCTAAAAQEASGNTPAATSTTAAPGASTAGTAGQGTYGGPIGVAVPVG